MYNVRIGTAWEIIDKEEKIILHVTSKGYAEFLCKLLNNGVTKSEIDIRPHPDVEYIEWEIKRNKRITKDL